jgi:hypothetical protein
LILPKFGVFACFRAIASAAAMVEQLGPPWCPGNTEKLIFSSRSYKISSSYHNKFQIVIFKRNYRNYCLTVQTKIISKSNELLQYYHSLFCPCFGYRADRISLHLVGRVKTYELSKKIFSNNLLHNFIFSSHSSSFIEGSFARLCLFQYAKYFARRWSRYCWC